MLHFQLKDLIGKKEIKEKRKITLEEISQTTGIHRTTLSKIVNKENYNTTTDVINKLCEYFDVDVSKLIKYIKD